MKRRTDKAYNSPRNIPKIDKVLDGFVTGNPEMKKLSDIIILLKAWQEAVGDKIASFTKIVNYKGQILYVKVESSVWRNEFYHIEKEILAKLRAKAKGVKIKKILFV